MHIGIIGCGRIAGHHCDSIVRTDGAELIAVCDLDNSKSEAYGKKFGVNYYQNYHTMLLENPSIDTVVIVTPSGMHYEHAMDVLNKYQKNIIVEKPTFMRSSDVINAYKKASEVGVSIFPVFQNRHNLAVQRVMQGIKHGELGGLRTIAVRVRWCRPQRYYDLAPWRGTFSMDGGCLTNQGIHHIDLLRKMAGEVKKVYSAHRTFGAEIEVEDTVTATLEFTSGAIGTLEITTAARPLDYEASISMVCEKGVAQIGGIAVNELQIYTPDPDACKEYSEDFSGNVYGSGHKKVYEEAVAHLLKIKEFSVEMGDVYSTIKLLNALYVSGEMGDWVDIESALDSSRLGRYSSELSALYRVAD